MADELSKDGIYHLSLQGPGLAIDKDIDPQLAGAIAQMTVSGSFRERPTTNVEQHILQKGPALSEPASPGLGQRLSLREYLQATVSDRGIHTKILAVGRYLRDHEKQDDFSREDIRGRFRSAGEPQPANFARDFQKAVRAGWIAEDHENRGRFYVTRTGDQEVDRRQGQGSTPVSPARARRRRRPRPIDGEPEQ
jgi:hypothetical protein